MIFNISGFKEGFLDEVLYRQTFSSVFTVSSDSVYALPVGTDRRLIRVSRPVIQLQSHALDYSPHDEKFRAMVFGIDSVLWGIQFSYPQLFLDSRTKEAKAVVENGEFPNTRFFHTLQRWIRHHTIPTPFFVEGKRINVPIRLGKECLSWINNHPQLIKKNIKVWTS